MARPRARPTPPRAADTVSRTSSAGGAGMLRAMRCALVTIALGWMIAGSIGCSAPAPRTSSFSHDDAPPTFADLASHVANHIFREDPAKGVAVGLPKYDGALPDLTPAGIADRVKLFEPGRAALLAF